MILKNLEISVNLFSTVFFFCECNVYKMIFKIHIQSSQMVMERSRKLSWNFIDQNILLCRHNILSSLNLNVN